MFNFFKKSKKNQFGDFPKAKEMRKVAEQNIKIWSAKEIRKEILQVKDTCHLLRHGKLAQDAYDVLQQEGYKVCVRDKSLYNGLPYFTIDW